MANIIVGRVFIGLKGLWILVDSVIRQMHIQVVKIVLIGSYVFFSCKSSQSFPEDEEPQGIDAIDEHIYSQIKFQIINKKDLNKQTYL